MVKEKTADNRRQPMARLSFECRDADGDKVTIQTSEAEIDELVNRYPELKKFLTDAGFVLVKPYQGRSGRRSSQPREKTVFDGQHCPKCGQAMWDNRPKKQSGKYSSKAPDFKCSNRECGHALWPGTYEVAA